MDRPICHFEALRRQLLFLLPLDSLRAYDLERLDIAAVRWHGSVYGHRTAKEKSSHWQVRSSNVRRHYTDMIPGQLLTCSIIPDSIPRSQRMGGCMPDQSYY